MILQHHAKLLNVSTTTQTVPFEDHRQNQGGNQQQSFPLSTHFIFQFIVTQHMEVQKKGRRRTVRREPKLVFSSASQGIVR